MPHFFKKEQKKKRRVKIMTISWHVLIFLKLLFLTETENFNFRLFRFVFGTRSLKEGNYTVKFTLRSGIGSLIVDDISLISAPKMLNNTELSEELMKISTTTTTRTTTTSTTSITTAMANSTATSSASSTDNTNLSNATETSNGTTVSVGEWFGAF